MCLPKIIFILGTISQPRIIKRIMSLEKQGYKVEVVGYDRAINTFFNMPTTVSVRKLGVLNNSCGFIKRFMIYYRDIIPILKDNKNENVCYYLNLFDLSLFVAFFSKKKYIYEISDLRYSYFPKFFEAIFKFIDKWIIKRSFLTVLITDGFIDYFGIRNKSNVIIQPNKISSYYKKFDRHSLSIAHGEIIKFGYVGMIRYPRTIFRFAKIIGEKYSNFEFHFYGVSQFMEEIMELCRKYSNVKYGGTFSSPQDLSKIYSEIDVSVIYYDVTCYNEKVAEPNKYYDSLFFCRPIIMSRKTLLSSVLLQNSWGYVIEEDSENCIIKLLDLIKRDHLIKISNNMKAISSKTLLDDDSFKISSFVRRNF